MDDKNEVIFCSKASGLLQEHKDLATHHLEHGSTSISVFVFFFFFYSQLEAQQHKYLSHIRRNDKGYNLFKAIDLISIV